ncbi:MAG: hypothetical protein ACLFVU_04985 [Phycisphaerae bacterium]
MLKPTENAQQSQNMVRRVVDADIMSGPTIARRPGSWLKLMANDAREIYDYRSALGYMVRSNLKVRYQRSVLGFLWTLLNPILMMSVLAVVFSTLMNRPLRTFTVYL